MNDTLYLKSTPSTNDVLKEMIREKRCAEGFIVYTDFQTAGKGQQGNKWMSEKGKNLLFSMVLYPTRISINRQFIISQLISIAIKKTLDGYLDDVSIKWPNDIYWKNKKLGGVLIENSLQNNVIKQSIIGVGLNINQIDFDKQLPNPVSMKQISGKTYHRQKILRKIRQNLFSLYSEMDSQEIKKEYINNLYHNKGYHTYKKTTGEEFLAKIDTVNEDGELILRTENDKTAGYYFKEIIFLH